MEDWQITGGRGNAKVITTFNAIVLFNENQKLKELITEIKEMLQVIKETNNVYPLQNNLNKILQKISESEVGND